MWIGFEVCCMLQPEIAWFVAKTARAPGLDSCPARWTGGPEQDAVEAIGPGD